MATRRRHEEAASIAKANRCAAVGRLMLGQFSQWDDFQKQTTTDGLNNLPRQRLRSGARDVRRRLRGEIDKFCKSNFVNMTSKALDQLHGAVTASIPYGFRMPLTDFVEKYATPKPDVLRDVPLHATISISLWGLQFEFPEDHFMKDIEEAFDLARTANSVIEDIARDDAARIRRDELSLALRREKAACRLGLWACFALVESYLNGLAWSLCYSQPTRIVALSASQRKLVEDATGATLRKKLLTYPSIVGGHELWDESDGEVQAFLTLLKPFRDSLAHPSPFKTPEKFGGYDKLSKVYGLHYDVFATGVACTLSLLMRLHKHVTGSTVPPHWMSLRLETRE